jgi:hypothetical protein
LPEQKPRAQSLSRTASSRNKKETLYNSYQQNTRKNVIEQKATNFKTNASLNTYNQQRVQAPNFYKTNETNQVQTRPTQQENSVQNVHEISSIGHNTMGNISNFMNPGECTNLSTYLGTRNQEQRKEQEEERDLKKRLKKKYA